MEIRKLVESDYDQVIELYTQLDEFHVQARPDCFVHREKDKIYPKDAFIHNLSYPGGWSLECLMAICLSVSLVQRCGKKASCVKI